MATMTKAQLAAENAALRSKLEEMREVTQRDYAHFRNEIERLEQLANTYRIERDEAARGRTIPDWQLAAQQRRAQYDAAVAAGRRVKFVGQQLVDY